MKLDAYHVREIDEMPALPQLPFPDYAALCAAFRETLLDPAQAVFTRNAKNGHPNFGAYLQSNSNEMVTWGILAVGEWLQNRDTDWIAPTYTDFYSPEHRLFLNSPGHERIEHWYMFYVNTLACAVAATLEQNPEALARVGEAADTLLGLAQGLGYDFNQQGYCFDQGQPFTRKDIYRQPDSIAGFAYAMLFAAVRTGRSAYVQECASAVGKYLAFAENPWYEIPNGSAGLYAAAWLRAHGFPTDVEKAADWLFDHEVGGLQTGKWGDEEINGLMMGWRGDDRPFALANAYSMETLMPLQFVLPAVRYEPGLAATVAKYALHALTNFQLFYGQGTRKLAETKPELSLAIPYEKLIPGEDGGQPTACGDFHGHRSVYGAGYLFWAQVLATRTNEPSIPALDLTVTDWLLEKACPVYLLHNPLTQPAQVTFAPAPIWRKKSPRLFAPDGYVLWNLATRQPLGPQGTFVALDADETALIALLPASISIEARDGLLMAEDVPLCRA